MKQFFSKKFPEQIGARADIWLEIARAPSTEMSDINTISASPALSALDENIEKKGKNAYYYAHSLKANGPAWDGKEEPRLLAVTPIEGAPVEQMKRRRLEFETYSWMDGKKFVKLFVDHSDPSSVNDEQITINWTDNSVEFIIADGDVDHYFHAAPLSEAISNVTHKRKSDAFVLILTKAVESSWYQLKKAP